MGECCLCGMLDDFLTWIYVGGRRVAKSSIGPGHGRPSFIGSHWRYTYLERSLWTQHARFESEQDILKIPCHIL